jgi:hypothetical protein
VYIIGVALSHRLQRLYHLGYDYFCHSIFRSSVSRIGLPEMLLLRNIHQRYKTKNK